MPKYQDVPEGWASEKRWAQYARSHRSGIRTVSIKLDRATRIRMNGLAIGRGVAPHALYRRAIREFLDREEQEDYLTAVGADEAAKKEMRAFLAWLGERYPSQELYQEFMKEWGGG